MHETTGLQLLRHYWETCSFVHLTRTTPPVMRLSMKNIYPALTYPMAAPLAYLARAGRLQRTRPPSRHKSHI